VHPESPEAVIELADAVGSTSQLIKAAQSLPNKTFIVATDRGIFYKMQQLCPDKVFIEAPTAGNGAACRSCAHCPWMAMNTLERVLKSLRKGERDLRRSGADPQGDQAAQPHARFHPGGAPEVVRQRLNAQPKAAAGQAKPCQAPQFFSSRTAAFWPVLQRPIMSLTMRCCSMISRWRWSICEASGKLLPAGAWRSRAAGSPGRNRRPG
jgi:hypothetical protein